MIKNGPAPSSEVAHRVDQWFKQNYENYPDGLKEYQTNEDGFEIKLDHDFDNDLFLEIVNLYDGFEGEELEDGAISVQQIEELGSGLLHRHSIGVTFGPDDIISLGGYDEPITTAGEPTDTVVEDTIDLLLLYLDNRSR